MRGPAVQASRRVSNTERMAQIAGARVPVVGAVLQGEPHDAKAAAGVYLMDVAGESGSATTLTRVFSGPRPARLRVAPTLTLAGKSFIASNAEPSKMVLASEISTDSHSLKPGAPWSPRGGLVVVRTTSSRR